MKRRGWDDLLFAVIGAAWVGVFVILDAIEDAVERARGAQ